MSSRADILKGDARNVSIDANGAVTLAPKLTEVYKTEQPYIWSSAIDASGNVYLGTGGDGKVFKVTPAGSGSLFTDLAELNVTALAIGQNGEIFAATSPDGKVYKIDSGGKSSVYFDAKEKYIWSLAVMSDGGLAVGTGESGKIYRVRSANATPESSLLFDTSDSHIITLAADKTGNLYAGTDSNGLVLRFGPDGKPFALLDSPLREIHEVKIGPDGSVYVLALGESASAATPAPSPTPSGESRSVSVSRPGGAPEPPQKSRYDLTGAKSAVYRILPDGGSDILWSSPTVTGFSIHAHQTGRGVLLGTSDKGRILNISNEGRESLILQTDASQVSTIESQGSNLYATSSNQGRLFKIGPDTVAEGSFESAVLDAKAVASWGRIWWRASGGVQVQTRSGNTEKADETWSPWANVTGTNSGQVASPRARYFQWRAVFKSSTSSALLNEVSTSYLPRNIAPEVLSIQILPTNLGLLTNPPPQLDPNIELSGLDPQAFGIVVQPVPPRRAFQRAARAFQWTAEDRNGDKLIYDVYYREIGETDYKLLRENISENFVTLDGQSLADGRYVVRVVAKDSPENPSGQMLTGERVSEPFDIDNSQPIVTAGVPQVNGNLARVVFSANDKASYLARAEYSVNGGPWMAVFAEDGISDSADERYPVELPVKTSGEYVITLKVFDASGNAGNARAVVKR
ncbi:MAG: hypothetical protein HOP17_09275 [Acidobacteria bacterium]|nr:hypothetical protein [Acidobacteriota bacterium]